MKPPILVLGVIGLVGCFLPAYCSPESPRTWSLWQLRHAWPVMVYSVMAAYAVATWIGLKGRRITRWHAVAAALAFGVVAYMLWPPIPLFVLVGWWLMQLSAFVGCLMAFAVALAPNVSGAVTKAVYIVIGVALVALLYEIRVAIAVGCMMSLAVSLARDVSEPV